MADEQLKAYKVEVNGAQTTLLLSDEDAKARGLSEKNLAKPANKSRTAENK